jgi:hypothetical protein
MGSPGGPTVPTTGLKGKNNATATPNVAQKLPNWQAINAFLGNPATMQMVDVGARFWCVFRCVFEHRALRW